MCRVLTFLCIAAFLVSAGCASAGRDFDSEKVSSIEKGKTTRGEVEKWFGVPRQKTILGENSKGAVLRYTYSYATSMMIWGSLRTKAKALVVDFDNKDIVVDSSYTEQE